MRIVGTLFPGGESEECGHGRHTAVGVGQWGVGQSLKVGALQGAAERGSQWTGFLLAGLKHQHSGLEVVATGLFVCSVIHPARY